MENPKLFTIDKATRLGPIKLAVASVSIMHQFYEEQIGLSTLEMSNQSAQLGIDGKTVIILESRPDGHQRPEDVGLFHLALLLPNRPALGQWINHFKQNQSLRSSADHLYSEAVYVDDPEGNVIEIYCDRPREGWYDEDGKVKMGTLPLDFDSLKNEAIPEHFSKLPHDTILGHVHLQVSDIANSMRFYHEHLGFDRIALKEKSGFVGAGGYHHHIGFNTFLSEKRPFPTKDSLGIINFSIHLPSNQTLEQLVSHLQRSNITVTQLNEAYQLIDPSGIEIMITTEP